MSAARHPSRVGTVIAPTLWKQCVGFMIGSALFALGSAPGFVDWAGASTANVGYFIGAWFFTGAGLIQLMMSGEPTVRAPDGHTVGIRAVWLSAATQSIGTLLFNVSTTSALTAHTVVGQKDFVWSPDAGGSMAFLVSGALGVVAFDRSTPDRQWFSDLEWWSLQINFVGCIAFAVSAIGGYLLASGNTLDTTAASIGTFVGALCFFVASMIMVPEALRDR